MRISVWIIGLVALVASLLLSGIGFSLVQMNKIEDEIIRLDQDIIPLGNQITAITANQLRQAERLERALRFASLGSEYADDVKAAVREYDALSLVVTRSIKTAEEIVIRVALHDVSPESRKHIDVVLKNVRAIAETHGTYEQNAREILAKLQVDQGAARGAEKPGPQSPSGESDHQEQVMELLEQNEGVADALADVLASLSTEVEGLVHVSAVQAKTVEGKAQKVTTVIAGLALLFAVILTLLVTRRLTTTISETTNRLATNAAELLAATTQQAVGAEEQTASVSQTSATVDEVVQTAEQASARARAMAEAALRSREIGESGLANLEKSLSVLQAAKGSVDSIAESSLALAGHTQAIGEIIASVNDIAEQTHLLALNAAIEAARAGEQGQGFSVVAGEVKSLADQSKKATSRIRQILGEIQTATANTVKATEDGARRMDEAIETAALASETIRTLGTTVAESAQLSAQITASADQQATGIGQIHQAMKSIDMVAQQTLTSTKQVEQAAQDLQTLGLRLQGLVSGGSSVDG